ncbi:MAG: polyprenyl synthetase family protein [Candidatus Methanoplasma sp.]|jgi:octaprenyl-diphosphate synthase|nr:polyprenyl synthetase family protein [Candidatus Methanoplasma sp.]
MDEPWYSSISEDLEKVERLMRNTVRSGNPELTEICDYVLGSNGKRIRPSMCLLAFRACGGKDPKKAIDVATAIEIIHNATLVHDDINDQGELRRGAQAAYKKYSIGKSIVAGDFMFALGYRLIGSASHEVVDFIVDTSTAMSAGEFEQKAFEHNAAVSEEDYMKIIKGKTARLIECGAKIGSFLAGAGEQTIHDVGEFAFRTGIAFQIVDDMLDVIGDEHTTGKRIGSDIMEGKPTLPTIYAMQDPAHGDTIKDLFRKKELGWQEVSEAIRLIKKTDAIRRCSEKAKAIAGDSISFLNEVEDSVYKKSLIDLSHYIADRDR